MEREREREREGRGAIKEEGEEANGGERGIYMDKSKTQSHTSDCLIPFIHCHLTHIYIHSLEKKCFCSMRRASY